MFKPSCTLRIVRDDSVLHLVDERNAYSLLGLLLGAGTAAYAIYVWNARATQPVQLHDPGHKAVVAFLVFAIGGAFWTRRDFQFDKGTRRLTWRQDRLIGRRRGEVPFEDIRDVTVATYGSTGKGVRVVLDTASGSIIVTQTAGHAAKESCETIVARIRGILSNPHG